MGAYTVYTAHQATIPPPPPLPILRPLRRYSFSQCFIDPERCFVCINKLENLPRTHKQTDKQTDREFNYRGHSYPLWIVGVSGPITARTAAALYCRKKLENLPRTDKETDRQTENLITETTLIPCGSSGGAGQ